MKLSLFLNSRFLRDKGGRDPLSTGSAKCMGYGLKGKFLHRLQYFRTECHVTSDSSPTHCACSNESLSTCQLGYEYDQSDFTSTLVTSGDWVCDESYNVPNIYTAGSAGSMVGTLFFSYVGMQWFRFESCTKVS